MQASGSRRTEASRRRRTNGRLRIIEAKFSVLFQMRKARPRGPCPSKFRSDQRRNRQRTNKFLTNNQPPRFSVAVSQLSRSRIVPLVAVRHTRKRLNGFDVAPSQPQRRTLFFFSPSISIKLFTVFRSSFSHSEDLCHANVSKNRNHRDAENHAGSLQTIVAS